MRKIFKLWRPFAGGCHLALVFYFFTFSSVAAQNVSQWDRFEASVSNSKNYSDSYNGVSLEVTYNKPDGSTLKFRGFYDGGITWKIRFMPDQLGTWSYKAAFSDGSPGIMGKFNCVASSIPGMIGKDDTNPRWFGFKGGKHILLRSFHVGDRFFAANWSNADRAAFLDWAQQQGYNMLCIPSFYLNRNQAGRGAGWNTPNLWPLNAAEYKKIETILDDLSARHIIVHPFAGAGTRIYIFSKNGDNE